MKNYLDFVKEKDKVHKAGPESCDAQESGQSAMSWDEAGKSGSRAYIVIDAATGAILKNCFVLRPETDDLAISAIRDYAYHCKNKTLSEHLEDWVCEIIRRKYAVERKNNGTRD